MFANSRNVPQYAMGGDASFSTLAETKLAKLGWQLGPTVLSTYSDPFRSWARCLICFLWKTGQRQSLTRSSIFVGHSFRRGKCLPFTYRNFPKVRRDRVKQDFRDWLENNIIKLWPLAGTAQGGFNAGLVVHEFYRANLDPSEMYVQTFPGSVKYRLVLATRQSPA